MKNLRKWHHLIVGIALCAAIGSVGFSYYMLKKLVGRQAETASVLKWKHEADQLFKRFCAQDVSFNTGDNVTLTGKLITRNRAEGTVILCHGFRRTKERMAPFVSLFPHHNILLFDFRASGESGGIYSSIGYHEADDVLAALHFVKERSLERPVIVLGVSMGAVAALKATRKDPSLVDALILDSAYAHLSDEIYHIFGKVAGLPYYPFLPIMMYMFTWMHGVECLLEHPEHDVSQLEKPVLLIHSATDTFTLPDHSVRLFGKAEPSKQYVRLWIGPPASHGKLFHKYPEYYAYKIKKFLRKASAWLHEALSREVVIR